MLSTSPVVVSNIATVCWRACKSHPIILISASFGPSAVGVNTEQFTRAVARPASLWHQPDKRVLVRRCGFYTVMGEILPHISARRVIPTPRRCQQKRPFLVHATLLVGAAQMRLCVGVAQELHCPGCSFPFESGRRLNRLEILKTHLPPLR